MKTPWSILFFVLAFFGTRGAIACSCVEDNSRIRTQVANAFRDAEFVGEVEVVAAAEVTESREVSGKRWSWSDHQYHAFTEIQPETRLKADIVVIKLWKGKLETASVSTQIGGAACGLPLQPGQRILLYAYIEEGSGRLESNSCTRTKWAKDSTKDIEILKDLTTKTPPDELK